MKNFFISFRKWFLLGFLFCLFSVFYFLDFYQYLNFDTLKAYKATAEQWTLLHYKTSVALYHLVFILLVACGIPCGTLFTLLGGFLFGTIAILYATLGTTFGGVILFLAVRSSIGAHIAVKSSGWIKSMEAGFQKNAFNYLLMLRFMPIFPCAVINVTAGALNVPLRTYILATAIGTLPATTIYVLVGRGLDKFLSANAPNFTIIYTPSILFPLLGLALLCILPILYKAIRHFRNKSIKKLH
jgi:uncharacterized membrane protein YdjX (TVP38/TMEM64 family)